MPHPKDDQIIQTGMLGANHTLTMVGEVSNTMLPVTMRGAYFPYLVVLESSQDKMLGREVVGWS